MNDANTSMGWMTMTMAIVIVTSNPNSIIDSGIRYFDNTLYIYIHIISVEVEVANLITLVVLVAVATPIPYKVEEVKCYARPYCTNSN